MNTITRGDVTLPEVAPALRASVLRALRDARVDDGLVGDFTFDALGDSTVRAVSLWRIEGGRLRYMRTLEVPAALSGRR